MYRIINGKGTGKTKELFHLAKENDAAIVCFDPIASQKRAHNYGLTGINFVSYYDFLNNNVKYTNKNLYIEDMEFFGHYVAGCTSNFLDGYTLSNED